MDNIHTWSYQKLNTYAYKYSNLPDGEIITENIDFPINNQNIQIKENLYLKFANIDIELNKNEKENERKNKEDPLLNFANEYDLPIAVKLADNIKSCYIRIIESERDSANKTIVESDFSKNFIYKYQYIKYIKLIKHILNVKIEIDKSNPSTDTSKLAGSLIYLLLFAFDGLNEFYDSTSFSTSTMNFIHDFKFFTNTSKNLKFHYYNKDGKIESRDLEIDRTLYYFFYKNNHIYRNGLKIYPFYKDINKFFKDIMISNINNGIFEIKTNYYGEAENIIKYKKPISHLKLFATHIISDIVTDNLKRISPVLNVDPKGKIFNEYKAPYLIDYIFLQTYFALLGDNVVQKCSYPKCNNYFSLLDHNKNTKYCSRECRIKMNKENSKKKNSKKTLEQTEHLDS